MRILFPGNARLQPGSGLPSGAARGFGRKQEIRARLEPGVPGFTLIEVLAVIVLLALVAGALGVNLAAASESASFRATMAAARDLDQRARLLARTGSRVVMRVEDEGRRLVLEDARNGAELAAVTCEGDALLALHTDPPSQAVVYDRLGRARDHEIELRAGGEDGRAARWRVCGESGWTVDVEVAEATSR